MQTISQYFLKQRMAYRVGLMFCTILVKCGDFLSILLNQMLSYLEKGDFAKFLLYLRPKVTLHSYYIYLFWVLVSGILNVFN